ncbi:50S ribosomal protein L4 [Cryptococcus deuterogattii 99/473]|uniref:Large ribosomal subunit protein uL4m n=2 Tax=Cryptococcus deuterogattii TaxID=1859096 RepID=A0A0D0UZS9_9TREE|nr:50S ribosomal protein L4 [Cryptococcus deuterogattii R265]KIR38130.1 50S ribosomal protein L4 [Cryptococcus deuterogattii Ram5]KIR74177.1 50S ribosomal protein L4 [Cryptococcus deuterogattii CA1014]KIY54165.1 50S ribosomal protein L4 [Cryptococcus deuterogattii 99/473]
MKRAARLVPAVSQPLRPCARPAYIPRPTPGPSSSPLALHAFRFASTAPPSAPAQPIESPQDLPPNINFEGLAQEADGEIERALAESDANLATWFPTQSGRHEPILLPVSSLASSTPTLPSDSNVVIALPPDVFAQPIRRDILHRCVVWYLSQLRSGTKSTKSRSTVAYSGRKLIPQKGTGKARAGDASSGTRRGGAPIHPIFPKNWAQALPRKVRDLGMRIALSSKLQAGLLRVVPNLNEAGWKGTNEAKRALADGRAFPEAEASEKVQATKSDVDSLAKDAVEAVEKVNELEGTIPEVTLSATEPVPIPRFGPAKDLSVLFLYSPFKPSDEIADFIRVTRNIPGVEVLSTEEVQVYDILKYRWLVMEGGAVDWFGDDVFGVDGFEGFEDTDGVEAVDLAREEALKA